MNGNTSRSKFLDQVRDAIRVRHYSYRTEQAYIHWIKRFILFHRKTHPQEMGEVEVAQFLTDLAVVRKVSPGTQNQAVNALVFLHKAVIERPLAEIHGVVRAKREKRLPVVLTQTEVRRMLQNLDGVHWLIACVMYGSGLRLMESLRLRVKDLDFDHRAIYVRNGKGGKDRVVTLPDDLMTPLRRHLATVKNVHEKDLSDGCGEVYLPYALARKYPNAGKQWGWKYVFPASRRGIDPYSGVERRHHVDESSVQKAVKVAVRAAKWSVPTS